MTDDYKAESNQDEPGASFFMFARAAMVHFITFVEPDE